MCRVCCVVGSSQAGLRWARRFCLKSKTIPTRSTPEHQDDESLTRAIFKPIEIHMKFTGLDNWFSLPFPGRFLASSHLASLIISNQHEEMDIIGGGALRSPEKQRKLSQIISFFGFFTPPFYSLLCICFHQQVKERFRLGLKWEILENENVWNECQVEGKSSKSLVDCPTERSQITQIKYDLLTWWD